MYIYNFLNRNLHTKNSETILVLFLPQLPSLIIKLTDELPLQKKIAYIYGLRSEVTIASLSLKLLQFRLFLICLKWMKLQCEILNTKGYVKSQRNYSPFCYCLKMNLLTMEDS